MSYEQRSEQMHRHQQHYKRCETKMMVVAKPHPTDKQDQASIKWLQMGTTIYEKEKGTHWKHDNELLRRRGKEWARYETKLAYDQDGWGIN